MLIKKDAGDLLNVWKKIFGNWRYIILAVFIGLFFYSINVLISNFYLVIYFFKNNGFFESVKFISGLFFGFKETILLSSFVSLIIISIFLGLLFSMMTYKTIMIKNNSGKTFGFFGTTGIFLGILAPGCPACAMGILPALGIGTAFFASLPFGGLELSILAILLLGFATFKITKNIGKGMVCEIK